MEYNRDNIDHCICLQNEDKVTFEYKCKPMTYKVGSKFLRSGNGDNATVFKLVPFNRIDLAKEMYGYTPGNGDWPEYETHDYEAVTRLVKRIFEEIDKKEGIVKPKPEIINQYQIF